MSDEIEVYTLTMARIYADQGHFSKAAAIYRHLLQNDPASPVLRRALEAVERQQVPEAPAGEKDLTSLFKEWIELAKRYKRLNKLRKIKTRL